MKNSNSNILIVFSLILFLLLSCSEGTVYQEPESNYYGIVKTDSLGKKLDSVDVDDDWTPECFEIAGWQGNLFCIYRVYPNPSKDDINLEFAASDSLQVLITLQPSDADTIATVFSSKVGAKEYDINLSFNDKAMVRNKIYRVYINAKHLKSGEVQTSYGDVMWE